MSFTIRPPRAQHLTSSQVLWEVRPMFALLEEMGGPRAPVTLPQSLTEIPKSFPATALEAAHRAAVTAV